MSDEAKYSFGARPFRVRVLNLIDVVLVSEAPQIHWLNEHPDVVRPTDPSTTWLHRWVDRRLSVDLGFAGSRLPVFLARTDKKRALRQKELDDRFEDLRGMRGEERDELASYVSGKKDADEIGILVQQWCGRLFFPHYRSDKDLYAAGRMLAKWPVSPPWRSLRERMSGRLDRAKERISQAAERDLHCVHATSIGMENVARSVRKMRKAAQQVEKRELSPDDILRECLAAPAAVLRGCAQEVAAPFLDRPLTKRTLIVFLVASAYAKSGDMDVAFMSDGWSACPAHRVVPEMLRAVWHAALHNEAQEKRILNTALSWSRLLQRAVS